MMRSRGIMLCLVLVLGGCHTLMPVELPTKFTLVVNTKAAKALGVGISESFLLRADQVIE